MLQGSNLPEMRNPGNTLTEKFDLAKKTYGEFAEIFRVNCQYLGILPGGATTTGEKQDESETSAEGPNTVTLSEGYQ